jgi:hypothetical protein
MPDSEPRKTFWTTLPGLLTGLASLFTAIAGLLALFIGRSGHARPAAQPMSVAATSTIQRDDPAQDAKACQRIAGQWWWSTGGGVTIGTDGGLQWRANPGDAMPAIVGRWVCTDSRQRQYVFYWSHHYTDDFTLSENGQRLSGTNQQTQIRLFGNRQE